MLLQNYFALFNTFDEQQLVDNTIILTSYIPELKYLMKSIGFMKSDKATVSQFMSLQGLMKHNKDVFQNITSLEYTMEELKNIKKNNIFSNQSNEDDKSEKETQVPAELGYQETKIQDSVPKKNHISGHDSAFKNGKNGDTISFDLFPSRLISDMETKYILVGRDSKRFYTETKILLSKEQVTDSMISITKRFFSLLYSSRGRVASIKCLREFDTDILRKFTSARGISLEFADSDNVTPPKYYNLPIITHTKRIMEESKVPQIYWVLCLKHVVYMNNHHIKHRKSPFTPYQIITQQTNTSKDYSTAPFGVRCLALDKGTKEEIVDGNFDGVFLGYDGSMNIAYVLTREFKIIKSKKF